MEIETLSDLIPAEKTYKPTLPVVRFAIAEFAVSNGASHQIDLLDPDYEYVSVYVQPTTQTGYARIYLASGNSGPFHTLYAGKLVKLPKVSQTITIVAGGDDIDVTVVQHSKDIDYKVG